MVLSSTDECIQITVTESDVTVYPYPELLSSQDKGDTKIILINSNSGVEVTIPFPI